MTKPYDPTADIVSVKRGESPENIAHQRDVTVRQLVSEVPFDREHVLDRIRVGQLEPGSQVCPIHLIPPTGADGDVRMVVAYIGEQKVQTYDRAWGRVRQWVWRGVVLDTMAVRYYSDGTGNLRLTTIGGGRRLTPKRLEKFHRRVLQLGKDAMRPLPISAALLSRKCRDKRFVNRLLALSFRSDAPDYDSIDQAAFRSREYMRPDSPRLAAFLEDESSVVHGFASDVNVTSHHVLGEVTLRFSLKARGDSIGFHLPAPVDFARQLETVEAQAQAFYVLVERAVEAVVGDGLFDDDPVDPALLRAADPLFAASGDIGSHLQYLASPANQGMFFARLDLDGSIESWLPHLRSLDAMCTVEAQSRAVGQSLTGFAAADPRQATALIERCLSLDLNALGAAAVAALIEALEGGMPLAMRPSAETTALRWAIATDDDAWDAAPEDDALVYRGRFFYRELISVDLQAEALRTALNAMHRHAFEQERLSDNHLKKLAWLVRSLARLPEGMSNSTPAHAVARSLCADRVGEPADRAPDERNAERPDQAIYRNAGLPVWPELALAWQDGILVLRNDGLLACTVRQDADDPLPTTIPRGGGVPWSGTIADGSAILLVYAFGRDRRVTLRAPAQGGELTVTSAQTVVETVLSTGQLLDARLLIDPGGIVIGTSHHVLAAFHTIKLANREPARHVLITGEPGVGKTHFAELIHGSSARKSEAFVRVSGSSTGASGDDNIARGEFTGFSRDHRITGGPTTAKKGHFTEADGGTLFIDDFEGLSMQIQRDLLSVLERRPVHPLGGKGIVVDVRTVLATNHDVDELAATGQVRKDLLERVPVRIHLPPLRDRPADVYLLVRKFADALDLDLEKRALLALVTHTWPGNVREVRDTIDWAHRSAVDAGDSRIDTKHLSRLPRAVVEAAVGGTEDECTGQLWRRAAEVATLEGHRRGTGLQKRAAELMQVTKGTASKMFRLHVDHGGAKPGPPSFR